MGTWGIAGDPRALSWEVLGKERGKKGNVWAHWINWFGGEKKARGKRGVFGLKKGHRKSEGRIVVRLLMNDETFFLKTGSGGKAQV